MKRSRKFNKIYVHLISSEIKRVIQVLGSFSFIFWAYWAHFRPLILQLAVQQAIRVVKAREEL